MHFLFLPIEEKSEHIFPFFIFHTTVLIQLPLNKGKPRKNRCRKAQIVPWVAKPRKFHFL